MATIKTVLLIAVLIYMAVGLAIYVLQRKLIYFPTPYLAVPGLEEISINNSGIRLQGYIANKGRDQALLYFGGNAESIAPSLAALSAQLPQVTILGFDYRGYGGSEGNPAESALYGDALNQFDAIADDYNHISVLGRSLGSAVAIHVAAERDVHKLILVTPFDSIVSIAANVYWYYPVGWLMKDRFDSASRASRVRAPSLILAAEDDNIVPLANTDRLLSSLTHCATKVLQIDGTEHNTIGSSPLYAEHIRAFLNDNAVIDNRCSITR